VEDGKGTTRLSFSYPEEMKKELQVMARQDNRSLSSFVQILLREGIARRSKKDEEKPKRFIKSH
jgi:metal-responsive CopG/Arc/MetJ family transcriptional regulator